MCHLAHTCQLNHREYHDDTIAERLEVSVVQAIITTKGTKPKKGERMTPGSGWKLAATKGSKRVFNGTLIGTVNWGNVRLAIFSVPKPK